MKLSPLFNVLPHLSFQKVDLCPDMCPYQTEFCLSESPLCSGNCKEYQSDNVIAFC